MRHTARVLAAATMIVAACWAIISQAAFLGLPRALKAHLAGISFDMPALAPIETMVDWLEAAYGGPIGPDK
jgi:hypothetical protein